MTTTLIHTNFHQAHDMPGHPEHAARLEAVEAALAVSGLLAATEQRWSTPATMEQIRAVHTERVIALVQSLSVRALPVGADTYTTTGTWDAALHAAGGAVAAVDAVLGGSTDNAFALVRPPGHHATPTQAMGFCFFNSIAVAAQHALDQYGLERVAIVDYDVHHGNGTQDIFYADKRVLFCSTHAYGPSFFPGTGAAREIGTGAGLGTTLNVPLPFGTGDAGAQQAFQELILPAVRQFKPQLLLVSAGFDAHWADPIGPLAWSVAGYATLTQQLLALADELCEGKIALVLEGGYNLDALAACAVAALRVLLRRAPGDDPFGPARARDADIDQLITRIKQAHPLFTQQKQT